MLNDGTGHAWAVSIEVDGRQKYLFETDKLQEMVGASAIMCDAAEHADLVAEHLPGRPVRIFQPASGEVRAWSDDRTALLGFAWTVRCWLDERGVAHSTVLLRCRQDHFTCDRDRESAPAGADRDAKEETPAVPADEPARPISHGCMARCRRSPARSRTPSRVRTRARPVRCSQAAAFTVSNLPMHGSRAGQRARPARRGGRCGVSGPWRSHAPVKRTGPVSSTRMSGSLFVPRVEDLGFCAADFEQLRDGERAITVDHLKVDPAEWFENEDPVDQYVAFICADGDGIGRLLTGLDWNDGAWRDGKKPWERNRDFSLALDRQVRAAFRAAVASIILPDRAAVERLRAWQARTPFRIPVLPQLLGGDDLWAICRRDVALRLAHNFASGAQERIAADPVLNTALRLSEQPAPSISLGIAFAKAGHPVHAMVDAAESLLDNAKTLRKGMAWGRAKPDEGCLDWHWIESSLSQSVAEARERGWGYTAPDTGDGMLLTTRLGTLTETAAFEAAALRFRQDVPRRKREQLEDILRRGHVLSLMAFEAWWKGLRSHERKALAKASDKLPEPWRLPAPSEERAGPEAAASAGRIDLSPWIAMGTHDNSKRYLVTPLLDLLALDNLAGATATGGGFAAAGDEDG